MSGFANTKHSSLQGGFTLIAETILYILFFFHFAFSSETKPTITKRQPIDAAVHSGISIQKALQSECCTTPAFPPGSFWQEYAWNRETLKTRSKTNISESSLALLSSPKAPTTTKTPPKTLSSANIYTPWRIHGTGIFAYIYLIFMLNVGKETIKGSYGYKKKLNLRLCHLGTNQYMLVAGQEKATQAIAGPHATQCHHYQGQVDWRLLSFGRWLKWTTHDSSSKGFGSILKMLVDMPSVKKWRIPLVLNLKCWVYRIPISSLQVGVFKSCQVACTTIKNRMARFTQ